MNEFYTQGVKAGVIHYGKLPLLKLDASTGMNYDY